MSLSVDFASFLDPTSGENHPGYHSFSSFAQLDMFASPLIHTGDHEYAASPMIRGPSVQTVDTDLESPSSKGEWALDQINILEAALEAAATNSGIFHTPLAGVEKLGRHSTHSSIDGLSFRSPASDVSHWEVPITPGLTSRESVDSISSNFAIPGSTLKTLHGNYAWDESSSSTLGSSGSATALSEFTTPEFVVPHRSTSQPHLGNPSPHFVPRPMMSMPALREEDDLAYLDVGNDNQDLLPIMDQTQCYTSRIGAVPATPGTLSLENDTTDVSDTMTRNFAGAFPGYGLGQSTMPMPAADTIFAAFHQPSEHLDLDTDTSHGWSSTLVVGEPSSSYNHHLLHHLYDPHQQQPSSSLSASAGRTINPMDVMPPVPEFGEEPSRPSTAPSQHPGEFGSGQSSVFRENMIRSISSESFVPVRTAPTRNLLSYAPQQFPPTGPQPQPGLTSTPGPDYTGRSPRYTMSRKMGRCASHQGLSAHVPAGSHSSTMAHAQSRTSATSHMLPSPVQMNRAGTHPLPVTRRLLNFEQVPPANYELHSAPESSHMATLFQQQSLAPAATIFHPPLQASYYRQPVESPMRIHPPPQAPQAPQADDDSVAYPVQAYPPPRPFPQTPQVTVHPPPATYASQNAAPSTPRRVHPPPHPGPSSASRVIARMPSTPMRRKASGSPTKSSKPRRVASQPSFGFVNFTPDDAEKLLAGVAPSGSYTKRRRDETASSTGAPVVAAAAAPADRESDDSSRMKRTRSNV